MFREGLDQPDHQAHFLPAVKGGLGIDAIVADSAVVLGIVLPEIIQEHLPAALVGLGISHRLHEELTSDLLFGDGLPKHEFLQFLDILVAVEGDAVGRFTVPACPSGLLVISLDALGNIEMDYEPYVRLVYPHSEGYGGDNDVYIFHQEAVLVLRPGLGVQSGMVGEGLDPVDGQQVGHLLHSFTT